MGLMGFGGWPWCGGCDRGDGRDKRTGGHRGRETWDKASLVLGGFHGEKGVSEVPHSFGASAICLEIKVTDLVTPGTCCHFPFPCSLKLDWNWRLAREPNAHSNHVICLV
jgi:hypothetical protein